MVKSYICVSLIYLITTKCLSEVHAQCDHSHCNNEGECYLKNGQKTCKCVEGAYEGTRCTTVRNNCNDNPCTNGGTCTNFVGNFYCECQQDYSGQNCSFQLPNMFQKLHLHYNHVVEVNKEENFLVILEVKGSVQIALELYSSNHLLESFAFPKTGPKFFKNSNNFRSVASKLGIRKPLNIPFQKGFYLDFKTTITQLGHFPLTLSLSDYNNRDLYFSNDFYIFSYAQPNQCFPKILNTKCDSPQNPLRVGIDQFNTFDPIVERSCGSSSNIDYKWSLWNYLDTRLFHKFGGEKERVLVIPPRTLWFDDKSPIFRSFYVLKLEVTETNKRKNQQGKAIFRCYILSILRPPHAVITGGNFREVNVAKASTISASGSSDENLPVNSGKQKLQFTWNCSTEIANSYCKENMGKGQNLKIPANALQVGQKYNFTVNVGAHTTSKIDIAWQEISPILQDPFLVTITCVRNCIRRLTNRQDILHLIADCIDCKKGTTVSYSWKIISPQPGSEQWTKRFILEGSSLPAGDKIVIQAEVDQGSRKGKSMIELEINEPPKGGKCTCDPKSGTEHDTIFVIKCKDFEDPNEPIVYTFSQGDKILSRVSEKSFKTRLSSTGKGGELKVQICDHYHACTTADVDVQITEKVIPSDAKNLKWFLLAKYGNTNLLQKLQSGDKTSAMVLINMAARQLSRMNKDDEKIQTVNAILNIMQYFDVQTTMAAQQLSSSLRELILSTEMDHKSVVQLGKILDQISKGFINSAKSGEIENMQWSEFVSTTKNLAETIVGMFKEINLLPTVNNAESFQESQDPFHENYPDYGELDFETIHIINNCLAGSVAVQRLFHSIGVASSQLLRPDEPEMNLNVSDLNLRFLSIPKDNIKLININQWGNKIDMSPSFLNELFRTKKSENLGLQVAVIQNNPFWWFPEQFKMNSHVIFLNSFGENPEDFDPDNNSITAEIYFDIFMSIKPENETDDLNPIKKEISGYVNATNDMATYGAKIPQNSLLIYEFISLDADLRVLTKVGKKPRYWMISEEYKVIQKSSNSSKIEVMNNGGEDSLAYIAIIPHGHISQPQVNFTFKLITYSCGTWSLTTSNWSLQHCLVGYKTTSSQIHCKCNHMSSFASKVHMTPNKLVLPREIIMSIDINIVFLVFVVVVVIFFIVLFIWACYRDKHDCQDIFVGSQNPKNTYMYIVTVSTGSLPFSGTTANVTIQLHGQKGNSEEYLLNTGKCKTILGKDTVYSFTLLAPSSLEKLTAITLSHDSAGRYPSWFCSAVRVKDISRLEEYIFLVRKWLSLIYSDTTKVTIPLSNKNDITKFKYLLREHTGSVFSSCFLCQLCCSTHTRSILNRKEKAMTLLTGKAVGALVSVLFFGKTTLKNAEDEQEEYRKLIISLRIFIIILIGIAAGGFTLYFITLCFFRAKTKKENRYKLIFDE